ncbi:hypothetical protein [Corynebacterium guangdongense]|uniref:DoxX family membrane protein n=1 Tax=Corynebacterium guangdongense TaxID=1783348 RepID=A0ABU1ZTU0_9CORY|nr:hypothetical protein [Corynebacterium guangdongense]MDR7328342.1 hypothetical protein [Corynebacterium guangdongense]WJZ16919.1 hypothetical protein CGUA_01595 [Corynebacterium guangdongense]
MDQMIPWLVFCLLFLGLCIWKPNAARVFIGLFFIVMAVAVNWVLAMTKPHLFVGLGADASLLPLYEWFFTDIIARAPQAVGILAGTGEIVLGVLMLAKGRWAALGLLGGIVFLLLITPLGIWTLPNPIMVLGLVYLLTKPLDKSLPEMLGTLRRRVRRSHSNVSKRGPTSRRRFSGEAG